MEAAFHLAWLLCDVEPSLASWSIVHPVDRITFSFPYDNEERARCLQLVLEFFRSLVPGPQYVRHVYLSLGFVWDGSQRPSSIDHNLFRGLLREIHRSGCKQLSILSIDIPEQTCREEPASDILLNIQDEQLHLQSLSLETVMFLSPKVIPWFMKQVTGNSSISNLKLSGTGFTASQLDAILCYFDMPHLESLTIGDCWLASVLELLRGSPQLHSLHFQELSSDFRVADGTFVSLPKLRRIRGNATILGHFIPLIKDVSWDSFWEIDIDTHISKSEGQSDMVVHSLDVASCNEVFTLLVGNGADVGSLTITFPTLADFSSSLFDDKLEIYQIMQACKINQLRIQLCCDTECENGKLMVRFLELLFMDRLPIDST